MKFIKRVNKNITSQAKISESMTKQNPHFSRTRIFLIGLMACLPIRAGNPPAFAAGMALSSARIGPDGSADASPLIQDAIDALPATGGTIRLLPGTYAIRHTITLNKPGISLTGDGPGTTVLKVGDSCNVDAITVAPGTKDAIISDLSIDGNKNNQTADVSGINVNGGQAGILRVKIERVHIVNPRGNGIVLANGTSDCEVKGCVIEGPGPAGNTGLSTGFGIYVVTNCRRNRIAGDTIVGASGVAGIRINNLCTGTEVTGNVVKNSDPEGTADRRGIFADAGADGPCTQTVIRRNVVAHVKENGIFSNLNEGTLIEGNVVEDAGGNGIECNDNDAQIRGNTVRLAKRSGISTSNCVGMMIAGNSVSLSGERGIYLFAANGRCSTYCVLNENVCYNNGRSEPGRYPGIEILAEAPSGKIRLVAVSGNRCFDNGTPQTQSYGLKIGNHVEWRLVYLNHFRNNLLGEMLDKAIGYHPFVFGNR